ncbi:MAG TPA: HupE/UreJ family protein [Beijerinckiaceae bacterium]|nr:HupE/UreJ family protein [Beijerinckiaceae bacterium]
MLARTVFAPLVFLAATAGASAHYPMGRVTPQTLWHGLLSGFGHPVIGLDHLAFVVAMGLLAAPLARGALMPLAFLAAGAVGSALHVRGVDLPFAEAAVALSVLALGLLILTRPNVSTPALAGLFAAAGLFHGHTLAESIVGAQPAPLAAYFVGLVTVQYAIALAALLVARGLATQRPALARPAFLGAGAVVALTGLAFLVAPTLAYVR